MMMGQALVADQSFALVGQSKIQVKIGFAFGGEASQIRRALYELAASEEGVSNDPEPVVRFRNVGSRSMDFEVTCWVDNPGQRDAIAESLNRSIYRVFMSSGCSQQVVYTIWS